MIEKLDELKDIFIRHYLKPEVSEDEEADSLLDSITDREKEIQYGDHLPPQHFRQTQHPLRRRPYRIRHPTPPRRHQRSGSAYVTDGPLLMEIMP